MLNQETHRFGGAINYRTLLDRFRRRYGAVCHYHVEFPVSTSMMLQIMKKLRSKPRSAEVVMIIPNESRQIWLHTKASYPKGVYRLMTGGVEPGESPQTALKREVKEETGFDVEIDRCLAIITYNLANGKKTLPFTSYMFLTRPTQGIPQPTDPNEAITNFKPVMASELSDTAQRLRSLNGRYADWGNFRAIAHEVAGDQLEAEIKSTNGNSSH